MLTRILRLLNDRRQSRHNVGDNEPDGLESLDGSEPYLSEMTRRVLRMSEGYPDNDLPTDAVAARHHAARD
ncbi:MAG TPA: hypothetical protein VFG14_04695, partial [Chthoniobacteraceae bacterium]|nr:hypothetical protein [Chthoniobacteraceae bacterium]